MQLSEKTGTTLTQSPLVSVVIPAYGRPEHLRSAVASVLQGGHDAVEVIVVDDGSPVPISEGIGDLIENGTVRCFRQENAGSSVARNKGASLGTGEFLMFLDDDDLVVPGSIALRVAELMARPDVAGVFGRMRKFRDEVHEYEADNALPVERIDRWTNMTNCQLISPGQAVLRRADFLALGGFATDCTGSDDWDMWIRMSASKGLWRMNHFALSYRLHAGNFSHRVIAMAKGASTVARRARLLACDKHAVTATFLTRSYVSELYENRLRDAARAQAKQGAWRAAARHTAMRLLLATRRLRARFAFKLAVISRTKQWRLADAANKLNGRGCADCDQIPVLRAGPLR